MRYIAVAVVVAVIVFSLLVLFGGGFGYRGDTLYSVPDKCITMPAYYCSVPIFSNVSGMLTLTISQNTGQNWAGVVFAYAPQGTPMQKGVPVLASQETETGVPIIPISGVTTDYALQSGETQAISLDIIQNGSALTAAQTPVGTQTAGTVWACFNPNSAVIPAAFNNLTGCTYVQIATLTAKAT